MSGVTSGIVGAYMVPGLPQLAFDAPPSTGANKGPNGWQDLQSAMAEAGKQALAQNPDVLVIYSSQWISVLGHSFQYAANPRGVHVDENWHALGDFPFSFQIDRELTALAEQLTREQGLATKLVDYEGFPIDTGTLVTLKYFNPENRIPTVIVSANIYAGPEDSMTLGSAVGEAIRQSGKKAVLINCAALSHRFLTEAVTPQTDRFARSTDDEWNRSWLALLEQGKTDEALALAPEYVQKAGPEMGLKGFYWTMGALGSPQAPAEILAYGPLWGTGAVVLRHGLH